MSSSNTPTGTATALSGTHGRPYGGRQGGEIGHQRPQSPRPMTART